MAKGQKRSIRELHKPGAAGPPKQNASSPGRSAG